MYPVTGPFAKSEWLLYPPPWQTHRTWHQTTLSYRQAKPYNVRLAYLGQRATSRRITGNEGGTLDAASVVTEYGEDSTSRDWAKIKAWDRFVDQATETAQFGETLAEFNQSGASLLRRIRQFDKFVHHLRYLEFGKAADTLELPRKSVRDRWSRDRTVAQNIIEVQYGWRPLIGDMFDAMSVLTRDIGHRVAKGRGSAYRVQNEPGPLYTPSKQIVHRTKVQYLADIRMSNPNLALLSALGLTNPLGTLAALVPYSFVLDWFTNFSQALAGYNRFMGLSIENPSTTVKTELKYVSTWNGYGWQHRVDGETVRRTGDLKVPNFTVKPFTGWSPERALNAISLLILQLPKRAEDRQARARGKQPLPYNWDKDRKIPYWWVP